jgi:hypothetical protein
LLLAADRVGGPPGGPEPAASRRTTLSSIWGML